MGRKNPKGNQSVSCGLTLEDEFTLTRIRAKAQSLTDSGERDQYLWTTVFRLICRERAYKTVMNSVGVSIETNMRLFDDDERANESD
jgi:hypothetical protein